LLDQSAWWIQLLGLKRFGQQVYPLPKFILIENTTGISTYQE